MKKIKCILLFAFFSSLITFSACKKVTIEAHNASSIKIIDASEYVPELTANFSFSPIPFSQWLGPNQGPVTYGTSVEFGKPSGSLPVVLISSQDTLHPFYKNTLNLSAGGSYSLYVIGQNQAETMLLKDEIPAFQDSTSGVRFVNLSPDSEPITINLQGNSPSQTEFTSLAYKQISDFKSYPAPITLKNYKFEIRDAATGTLLSTFTWTFKRFYCNTLVVYGLENDSFGNFPFGIFQVNHY